MKQEGAAQGPGEGEGELKEDKLPLVVVGNKLDLEEAREVPRTEGESLAAQLGHPFYEVSAKTDLDHVLMDLVAQIVQYRQERPVRHSTSKKSRCILS